ncbi:hypothetical protein [Amycolatopsis samaneae]|uniref:Uncharacterized protein n=1 Tax=Amycolatopsis samaneae TaxID=664691 RepID=A0ABW5GP57_9PSEU
MTRLMSPVLTGLLVAATAVAAAGPAVADGAGEPVWKADGPPVTGRNVQTSKIVATGPDNAWAVHGFITTIPADRLWQWNGRSWAEHKFVGDDDELLVGALASTGPSDAWVLGSVNRVTGRTPLQYHWDGRAWSSVPFDKPEFWPKAATALAPDDVWVVGSDQFESGPRNPAVVHWNGTAWRTTVLPGAADKATQLNAVHARGTNDIWVAGREADADNWTKSRLYIAHYDGVSWTRIPAPPLAATTAAEATAVLGRADSGEVFVGGHQWPSGELPVYRSFVLRWNGSAWRTTFLPGEVNSPKLVFSGDELWVGARGSTAGLFRLNGSSWSRVAGPLPDTTLIESLSAVPGVPGGVWAGGLAGRSEASTSFVAHTIF